LLFIQTAAIFGINDRVNETLGITIELEITSQAADFFNQILSFSAYGGSSIQHRQNPSESTKQTVYVHSEQNACNADIRYSAPP
jgi:hypothetical protein